MDQQEISQVLFHYAINPTQIKSLSPLGNGLIHGTYRIELKDRMLVLQAYNENVFPFPERIAFNLTILSEQKIQNSLPYLLPLPIPTTEGHRLTISGGKMWRIFPFVSGQTLEQIQDPNQAYLAARAFSQLSKACERLDLKDFQETIPNFHRLDLRFEKLQEAAKGSPILSQEEIEIRDFYLSQSQLVDWYRTQLAVLPARVTHNDTKINNLIFSENGSEVKAVIDLDTLMGGFLLYDFGDLVRTVACTLPETSTTWSEIHFVSEIFEQLLRGYWEGVKDMASPEEAQSLLFGGEVMTLIMGIRFFTDHLQGNVYYRVSYPEQNFDRAKNQMIYLQTQQANRPKLQEMWKKATGMA